MKVEITIHDMLNQVQRVRPISLSTLYRWLKDTGIGAGRVYYSQEELRILENYAVRQNNIRPFSNYERRLKNAQV